MADRIFVGQRRDREMAPRTQKPACSVRNPDAGDGYWVVYAKAFLSPQEQLRAARN
jgi:hypothetical protein